VLHCSSEGCDDDVTVQSTGSEILAIYTIELDGPAAGSFSQEGDCGNRELEENETCSITVHYTPGEADRIRDEATETGTTRWLWTGFTGKGGRFVGGRGRLTGHGQVDVDGETYEAERGGARGARLCR